jgi:DNA-binding XRE family transcriptional regulator
MSSLIGIGARMQMVRAKLDYPQTKMAAVLNIADRSYKNYETEKRELPLSVAVNFCNVFNVNLHWLVFGETMVDSDTAANLVAATFQAVEDEAIRRDVRLTAAKASKIGRYLFSLSLSKGTLPADEVKEIFGLIE